MKLFRLLLLAATFPALASAQTTETDTSIIVKDKKIVVTQQDGVTTVKIYGDDGKEMKKISQTQYIDGQEIEKIYVTSPLIPQKSSSKHKQKIKAHYPAIFLGNSQLPHTQLNFSGNDEMYSRDNTSWEWGINLTSFCLRITNNFALTSAFSIGQVHHHFSGNHILNTTNNQTFMETVNDKKLRKSYISYNVVRMPFMFEWQKRIGRDDLFFALGSSVEYRWGDHSRYMVGHSKTTVTNDINLNPIGVNLEARLGYGNILIYGRSAVSPLLKKSRAPECYPLTIGIGLRL